MIKKHQIILLIILILAAFLRLWQLSVLPPSMEWDEAATGYDAYSILKTGKDQFGHFLPLTMRSLDDYKPPLYTYLTVGSIAFFGWTDFAVRFPAAFFGILAVLTTYFMVYQLFKNRKLSLLAALFLCISPWHVHFSRLALETNTTIFFTTFGIWAFLKGLDKGGYLILTAFSFGLNLFLYHNTRVFIPLLSVILLTIYFKDLWKHKKYLFISMLIFGIFIIRLLPILFSIEGQMRFQGTSIFSIAKSINVDNLQKTYIQWKIDDQQQGLSFTGRLFHSEKILFGLQMLRNYFSHFDPNFWVFTNDSLRHHVSEMGILYLVDLPLIYTGLYFLIRGNKKTAGLIIAWMLLTPIPASVTRDAPHALRTTIFLPTFQILVSLAIINFFGFIHRKYIKQVFLLIIIFLYTINSGFFLHQYFVHYAKDSSLFWLYGRKEAALYAETVKSRYDRIIVYPKYEMEQAHIFFLYYLKYDPVKYLQEGGTVSGGWAENRNQFDKYQFKPFNYSEDRDGRTLFIGLPAEFPKEANILKRITYLNGTDAVWIAD